MSTSIWWIRRDLRLTDNQALSRAISSARSVIPVFVLDQKLTNSPFTGSKRLSFLFNSLAELDTDLKKIGSRLVIRKGDPAEVLAAIVKESRAKQIYAEADFSPYALSRDERVAGQLPLQLIAGPCLSHPESLLNKDGKPYKVFTPYMRNWKARYHLQSNHILPAPKSISTPPEIQSQNLPIHNGPDEAALFKPGERAAQERLDAFVNSPGQGIFQYAELRNGMADSGTAQISAYLRFGVLSTRQCVFAAQQAMDRAPDEESRKSADVWLNELIWREFYIAILYHFPDVLKQSFRQDLRTLAWRNDGDEFSTWCEGQTGYPIVDAAMRQLLETGWMHNRGRMIVASFLVKDLVIDWRWGEKFFMQHLVDGDPAANNGGWQWTAGTGTDAAPYFRVFNPILQGKKFDPRGDFIRQWIPELSEVPQKYIHTPWLMPDDIQKRSNCLVGRDYPQPLVEHGFARERILDVYNQAKRV